MINIITIYGLVWLFTSFTPVQKRIDTFFLSKEENMFLDVIWQVIQCQKCLTFWTFVFVYPLYITLIMTMIAQIHTKLIK